MESLITALGFAPEVAKLYDRLQALSGRPLEEVTESLGMTREELADAAALLVEAEIVEIGSDSVRALPPAAAISRMLESTAARAQKAHDRLLSISRAMPYVAGSSVRLPASQLEEPVEPIDGEVFRSRYMPDTLTTLVRRTTGDLLWLRPDQWSLPWEQDMVGLLAEAVRSGRRARGIYPVAALSEAPAVLQARADAGEEIRVLPEVPTRLLVVGVTHALVPEPLGHAGAPRTMVRQRGIVEALRMLFEQMWADASPVADFDRGFRGAQVRRQLLRQLAAGAQDEQIARRLGLSLRTVRRRVAELMSELHAESRFQAGVEAARRGWL